MSGNTNHIFISKNHFLISRIQICDNQKWFSDVKKSNSWMGLLFNSFPVYVIDVLDKIEFTCILYIGEWVVFESKNVFIYF